MFALKKFTKKIHMRIASFEAQMEDQIFKAQVPDLSGLYEEVAFLRLKVCTLAESHVLGIALVITSLMQLLTTTPPFIFDLFSEEDNAQTVESKRR